MVNKTAQRQHYTYRSLNKNAKPSQQTIAILQDKTSKPETEHRKTYADDIAGNPSMISMIGFRGKGKYDV